MDVTREPETMTDFPACVMVWTNAVSTSSPARAPVTGHLRASRLSSGTMWSWAHSGSVKGANMRLVTFAIAATLALTGCPKNGGDGTIVVNNHGDDDTGETPGDAGPDKSSAELPPEGQLLALLDEIVARVTKAEDCDELASALSNWTNRNKKKIAALIEAIATSDTVGEEAAEAINADPYGNWLVKIKPTATLAVDGLMDVAAYRAKVQADG